MRAGYRDESVEVGHLELERRSAEEQEVGDEFARQARVRVHSAE